MNRRDVLSGGLACMVLSVLPQAHATRFANGIHTSGVFRWENGGGDPFDGTLGEALTLLGVSKEVGAALQSLVAVQPRGMQTYTLVDGDLVGNMVSGRGTTKWVAKNVEAYPSLWRAGVSRDVAVWYYRDEETGVQYRLMRAEVCGNWCLMTTGPALPCRCNPLLDAC